MAQIKMQYGIGNITPRPIKMDLIKQMQNKQGYTNGTSTGNFTDNQVSYEVQASPAGYWEYTVYGKLDISKIKGKTFKIIYNFEDVVLSSESTRFGIRVLYSADGNYILPTNSAGGLASGISFCGLNSTGTVATIGTPTQSGNSTITQQGMILDFSNATSDIVDFYITAFYAPQSSQSIRPSGKLSIRIEEE